MIKTKENLQAEINDNGRLVNLDGEYRLTLDGAPTGESMQSIITVSGENKIIDGSAAHITVEITTDPGCEVRIFNVENSAQNVTFRNMKISVEYAGENSSGLIQSLHNNACNLSVRDCDIDFTASEQINYAAIYNDGKMDMHTETPTESLMVFGCRITADCSPSEAEKDCVLHGIENHLSNSASISNNNIFIKTNGMGEGQKAVGIYNSGRYARIENNNIKTNGSHNKGNSPQKAHACGIYNSGMFTIFTGNNIVAEWGGRCVGLHNFSMFCNITANKIHATHTVSGRCVILSGEHNVLADNMITNTSSNPHFVDVLASSNTVTSNMMVGMKPTSGNISGCGILVKGEPHLRVSNCNISNNTIERTKDFGIALTFTKDNVVKNNICKKLSDFGDDAEFCRDYVGVYAENSVDIFADNIGDGEVIIGKSEHGSAILKNYDEAIKSL